ncbi:MULTISPECIES: hypothetical protein [Bradyrhizobium]|uniref:hypothetical protein n=1 Tax=Bradyrhizobium elkanii TaxID=29448 RepID=UPI000841F407|nr:hypothetical protein [Bradyrhizobium elkanii]ODM71580.1 hypothetical protein A6X20_41105 [Bradyrhizobium elkanii]ODM79344.1 hypothetical protein A6452_28205 [Bradyrhizobium elkanii]
MTIDGEQLLIVPMFGSIQPLTSILAQYAAWARAPLLEAARQKTGSDSRYSAPEQPADGGLAMLCVLINANGSVGFAETAFEPISGHHERIGLLRTAMSLYWLFKGDTGTPGSVCPE